MKILIGTPCGGGQASVQYMLSLIDIFQNVAKIKHNIFIRDNLRIGKEKGILSEDQLKVLSQLEAAQLINFEIGLYTLANESLLSRGRNHIAAVAIRQGWDKLFFIDADAKFTFDQFVRVALAPYDFVAGACPLKVLPIHLNYLPFEDDEHYHKESIRSVESLQALRIGHNTPYIPVAFIGTAFMCLSRNVLLRCAEISDEYQYPNPSTGHLHTHWNMFDTKPMHDKFMSEDWSMCHRWRSLGGEVILNADVIISHIGSFTFGPELHTIKAESSPQPIQGGQL